MRVELGRGFGGGGLFRGSEEWVAREEAHERQDREALEAYRLDRVEGLF